MSSFFTLPASQKKRKRTEDRPGKAAKRRHVQSESNYQANSNGKLHKAKGKERDDSISGSDSEDAEGSPSDDESEATSEEGETAAERRVRLAKRYLENLRGEVEEGGFDAEDIDKDLIAQRLKQDVDEAKGRQYRQIALSLDLSAATQSSFRADTQSTTAVAVCPPYAYTVSKDQTLIKWELSSPNPSQSTNGAPNKPHPPRTRPKQVAFAKGIVKSASTSQTHGHTAPILSLDASPNGTYLATGGADNKLIIWSASDLTPHKTFTTHRDAVTSLSFSPNPPTTKPQDLAALPSHLFSASLDRTLKTYTLSSPTSLAYIETLFGHQDHVAAVAAMGPGGEQAISVGARDRTARLWRVIEETQLVFRADSSVREQYQVGSVDVVATLPPNNFVTGSDAGSLCLWAAGKKKALCTIEAAHGVEEPAPLEESTAEVAEEVLAELRKADRRRPQPRAVTALTTLPKTDVVVSGSWDGWVRVWKVSEDKRSISAIGVVGRVGVQNGVVNCENGDGQVNGEPRPRLGNVRGVINSIAVFERRKELEDAFGRKKEGESLGLCILVGTGKEMRLGRWRKFKDGRNGAVVFEVPVKAA